MFVSAVFVFGMGACGLAPPKYLGEDSYEYFPFDGTRTWEFINADPNVSYKLVVTQLAETTLVDGRNVYSIEHAAECVAADEACVEGAILRTVRWSSSGTDGVFIHGVLVGAVDAVFDPGITVAGEKMLVDGEPLETATSDGDWTSDLTLKEVCPVVLQGDWESCSVFEVDDQESSSAHADIAGTYWANVGYNVVAFDLTDDDVDRWELSSVVCAENDPCDGVW